MADRGNCRCCGNEYNINADGTVRYHLTDKPDCQEGPDSRKCKGVGQRPREERCDNCGHAGHGLADSLADGGSLLDLKDCTGEAWRGTACACAREIREMDTGSTEIAGYVCRIPAGPTGCGRPVQLTANDRARSHLNPQGAKCDGGSDWPIEVRSDGSRRDTRPKGEILPAARPEDLRMEADDVPGRVTMELAYDGAGLFGAGSNPDSPGEEPCEHDWGGADVLNEDGDEDQVTACIKCGLLYPDGSGEESSGYEDTPLGRREVPEPTDAMFDPTHRFTDESGINWVHPGDASDCSLPECCTHPRGFEYGDDDNGHSGSFCFVCGAPEPERVPGPDDWRCPADLLAQMPPDVQALAAQDPVCWECGHEVTPLVDRFGPDGRPEIVVWGCEPVGCKVHRHNDVGVCRPRTAAQTTVGQLDIGVLFRRHTAAPPVSSLVFRVQTVTEFCIQATVVSAGAHAGRTGELTNLTEEITCTDLDGQSRPRTRAGSRSSTPPKTTSRRSSPDRPTTGPTKVPGSTPVTTESVPPVAQHSSRASSSEPTGKAAGKPRSAAVTTEAQAAGDFLTAASGSYGEAEAKYGRWGRYKLRHPSTGKTVEWTRATTFAKSISDTFTLSQWAQRNVLLGATLRPDIVAAAHGKDIAKDREQLNTWTEELQQAAGSKVAANLGTAVHSFTERVDRNWERRWEVLRDEIPEDFRPHVEAYILLLEEYGLEPVPHMIEFSTGVLQYEVMGTSDNCYRTTKHLELQMPRGKVRLSPGEHVIGDKKTGKDLDYGWQEICIQLALYAQGVNTQGIFNWADETWDADPLSRFAEPGTKVREDVGVILHLPVDPRSTKKPALHGVDLESGWNAAVLCERVRSWRKVRTLAGPVAVVETNPDRTWDQDPDTGVDQGVMAAAVRPPTLRERAEAVTSNPEASKVYEAAVAAKLPVAEVKELIAIMQAKIAQVAEPGGAKV